MTSDYTTVLLNQEFSHFLTLTCRQQPLSLPGARRIAENVYKHIIQSGSYFWVAEKFNFKRGNSESYHIHSLIKSEESEISKIWATLFNRYGRSRIEKIESNDAVIAYCQKYIVKEMSDYDFRFTKPGNQSSFFK